MITALDMPTALDMRGIAPTALAGLSASRLDDRADRSGKLISVQLLDDFHARGRRNPTVRCRGGVDDALRGGTDRADFGTDVAAVAGEETAVDDRDIGVNQFGLDDRRCSTVGDADNFEVMVVREELGETFSYDRVRVGDEDPDHCGLRWCCHVLPFRGQRCSVSMNGSVASC